MKCRNAVQFQLLPIDLAFSTKIDNNKINLTYKRSLRLLFNDYDSSFDELLEKSKSVKMHIQNLQELLIEIYKSIKNLNPSCTWEFHGANIVQYDLR